MLYAAGQMAVTTPIKVAIPTEVNRKAFPDSPGGLISPGDNSTVYEPDRYLTQLYNLRIPLPIPSCCSDWQIRVAFGGTHTHCQGTHRHLRLGECSLSASAKSSPVRSSHEELSGSSLTPNR